MIHAVGHDIVDLSRWRNAQRRHGERLLARIFTEREKAYAKQFADPAPHLAVRFAAKEAAFKALGTGLTDGISWHDAEITREKGMPPKLVLHNRALELARQIDILHWHVALTHSGLVASAVVIAEK